MIPLASSYAVVSEHSLPTRCQNRRFTSQSRVASSSSNVKHLVALLAHPRCRREPKTQITAICVHFLRLVNGVNIAWDNSSNRNGTNKRKCHSLCLHFNQSQRTTIVGQLRKQVCCIIGANKRPGEYNISECWCEICFAVTLDGFMNRKLRTPLAEKSRLEAEEAVQHQKLMSSGRRLID